MSVNVLSTKVTTLETTVTEHTSKLDEHDQLFNEIRGELKLLRDGSAGPMLASSKGRAARTRPPRNERRSIVLGGFPHGTEKAKIESKLKEITQDLGEGVEESFCPGKFGSSLGISIFRDKKQMWQFLKANKGNKFQHEGKDLFHSIELSSEEMKLGSRVSSAVKVLSEHVITKGKCQQGDVKAWATGDWNAGRVIYREGGQGNFKEVYIRKPHSQDLQVARDAGEVGGSLEFDFGTKLSEINQDK